MADTKTNTNNTKQRPVHEVRIGCIKATIWANAVKSSNDATTTVVMHSVVPARIYVAQDGSWAESKSLRRDDLLLCAKVLNVAHTWICEREQEERKQSA